MSDHDKATHARECKGSIPIVPFRYAIMPKIEGDSTQYYYDACPTKLDKDFDKLDTAAYSIRTLRPGYIYLYDEDLGTTYLWEADGEGNYKSLRFATLEEYGKPSNVGSSMTNISVCDKSNNVYIAYSQDLWSIKGLAENIKNKDKIMVKLNVPEILNASKSDSNQENIIPSGDPEKWIEEYKTPKDNYKDQFDWSSYQPENVVKISNLKTKATHYDFMHQAKLPIFLTLYDNIAAAIDLGNIAASHMRQLSDIKNIQKGKKSTEAVPKPVPVEMTLNSKHLTSLSIEFHRKRVLADLLESILAASYKGNNLAQATELAKETRKYYPPGSRSRPRTVGNGEARLQALRNTNAQGVLDNIDLKELMNFRVECDQEDIRMETISAKVLKATNDHKTVLLTMELEARAPHPRQLASTLATYDRNNLFSATALENAIALSIQGMGIPVPDKAEVDQRYKLLERWAENENSPLFIGIKAFSPFSDKIDSAADVVAGLGDQATALHKLFPYALGTEIIVNEVTAYSFKKVNGATRWNKANSVTKNVNEALKGTNLKKLFKALQGRYGINKDQYIKIGQKAPVTNVSKTYMRIIDLSVGDNASRALSINGTRTTTITDKITTTKTRMNTVSKAIGEIKSLSIPAGVAWMHSLNMLDASRSFSRDDSLRNSLNLGSALFGFVGAFNEASVAALESKTAGKLVTRLVGKKAKEAALGVLTKTVWRKFLGYGGAALEAATNFHDMGNLGGKGDNDAAFWAGTAALSLGAGGAILTYAGGLALGASTVPVAGWIAAGVILLLGGIAAIYMKIKTTDTPLEIWVSRTDFGHHRTTIFGKKTDIPFKSLSEELQGYYNVTFSPVKIDDAENILGDNAETTWDGHYLGADEGKFVFLLPAYIKGVSHWSYRLDNYDEDDVDTAKDREDATLLQKDMTATVHKTKEENEGLYVYMSKVFSNSSAESATLDLSYWPNGYGKDPVFTTIYLDE